MNYKSMAAALLAVNVLLAASVAGAAPQAQPQRADQRITREAQQNAPQARSAQKPDERGSAVQNKNAQSQNKNVQTQKQAASVSKNAEVKSAPKDNRAEKAQVGSLPASKSNVMTQKNAPSDKKSTSVKSKDSGSSDKKSVSVKPKDSAPSDKKSISVKSKDSGSSDKKSVSVKPKDSAPSDKQSVAAKPKQSTSMLVERDGRSYFLGTELPRDYKSISIYGEPEAGKAQAVAFIKQSNPDVRLACTVEELVDLYWQEAEREGVRPDLALSQSLVETGTYAYGGDVQHNQNNFCGLGTTGGGVRGASFKTPELGVRAHIQHLLAYTQKKRPQTEIVDPRYELAHKIRVERGVVDTWYGLNGTWAMGSLYCEKIMATYQKMLSMKVAPAEEKKPPVKDKRKQSMRERIAELMKEN
jgi:hypothetical protein